MKNVTKQQDFFSFLSMHNDVYELYARRMPIRDVHNFMYIAAGFLIFFVLMILTQEATPGMYVVLGVAIAFSIVDALLSSGVIKSKKQKRLIWNQRKNLTPFIIDELRSRREQFEDDVLETIISKLKIFAYET